MLFRSVDVDTVRVNGNSCGKSNGNRDRISGTIVCGTSTLSTTAVVVFVVVVAFDDDGGALILNESDPESFNVLLRLMFCGLSVPPR